MSLALIWDISEGRSHVQAVHGIASAPWFHSSLCQVLLSSLPYKCCYPVNLLHTDLLPWTCLSENPTYDRLIDVTAGCVCGGGEVEEGWYSCCPWSRSYEGWGQRWLLVLPECVFFQPGSICLQMRKRSIFLICILFLCSKGLTQHVWVFKSCPVQSKSGCWDLKVLIIFCLIIIFVCLGSWGMPEHLC